MAVERFAYLAANTAPQSASEAIVAVLPRFMSPASRVDIVVAGSSKNRYWPEIMKRGRLLKTTETREAYSTACLLIL